MLLICVLFANLACWLGFRKWDRKAQHKAELNRWAPFKQHPVIDNKLRKYAGELHDPRKRWAADRIKNTVRNFVNSESFNIAVDGLVNQQSTFWQTGRLAKKFFRPNGEQGDHQPLSEESCTIR